MSDDGLISGIALGLSIAALGIGIVILVRLLWQSQASSQSLQASSQPQYYQQPVQYQPQREEVIQNPQFIQKKKIIGYVTGEE